MINFSDQDVQVLHDACTAFAVTIPTPVTEAETFRATCIAMLDTVTAEAEPEPPATTASAKTIGSWVTATAGHAAAHDHRFAAARALCTDADQRVRIAWAGEAETMFESFRAPFDRVVVDLGRAFDGLAGDAGMEHAMTSGRGEVFQAGVDAADRLAQLAMVHRALSEVHVGAHHLDPGIVDWLRVLRVTSRDDVARRLPVRTQGIARYGLAWVFAALSAGCALRWATTAEIAEEHGRLPSERADTVPAA